MSTIAFDTLKFARTLREKANFTAEQAEGVSIAFAEASGEQLATKADIEKLDAKIDRAELRLSGEITLLKWMLGFTLAAVMAVLYILIRK